MADCYVASVRRGDVPCVETVLRSTADRENVRAVELSVAEYERLMSEQLDNNPADSVQAFADAHQLSEREAMAVFSRLVMCDTDGSSRHQLNVRMLFTIHLRRRRRQAPGRIVTLTSSSSRTPPITVYKKQFSLRFGKALLESRTSRPGS